jgi:hypothetical protein
MITNSLNKIEPSVNELLESVHLNYEMLKGRAEILMRSGISVENLPEDCALKAFALLGNHDRKALEKELIGNWQGLVSKGLAKGSINTTPTPELRLLIHAQPFIGALEDVWMRMEKATDIVDAAPELFRCSKRVIGHWGQPARLHFEAQGVECVLITPDKIFGLQSAIVTAEPSGRLAGSFMFPIDDGEITFKLMHSTGQIFRYIFGAKTNGVEG